MSGLSQRNPSPTTRPTTPTLNTPAAITGNRPTPQKCRSAGCHTGTETKPLHRVAEGQRGSHRHGLRTRIHPHFIRGRGISPRQPTVGRIFNCRVLLRPAKNWGKATDNCGKLTTTGQTNKLFQRTKRPKNQINKNTRAKQK